MAKKASSRRRPKTSRGAGGKSDPSISREAKDILLKLVAQSLGGAFLTSLGINLPPIVEALPAELPVLAVRAAQLDTLFRLENNELLHMEFQMTVTELGRFYRYQFEAGEAYNTKVHTVVFYGPGITSAPEALDRGSGVYRVHNVFIGTLDGDAVLDALRQKLNQGHTLDELDQTHFKLLPLMAHRQPLPEVVQEAVTVATALPSEERVAVIGTMLGLGYSYLGQEFIDQMLGVREVANALEMMVENALRRGKAEGKAEGEEQGQVRARHEDIIGLLAIRFANVPPPLEDRIMQITDLARLRNLVYAAATSDSLDRFAQMLQETPGA
jgi:hypothetical protein